jgi:hypothetical protein
MTKTKKVPPILPDDAPPQETRRQKAWHHLIALVLLQGNIVYLLNTFHAPFHFDDQPNIFLNPNVQVKSWPGFVYAWSVIPIKNRSAFSYLTLASTTSEVERFRVLW